MSSRIKYLIGNLGVIVNDDDRKKIIVTTQKSYPELAQLAGGGFSFTKDKKIQLTCNIKDYKRKMDEFEQLLYNIETKTMAIVNKLTKEEKQNESSDSSSDNSTESAGTAKSNKSKDSGKNKS